MARHVFRCPLRWADMDAFGHVNNVSFLRYLEEARIDFMFRLAQSEGGVLLRTVVARHEIDYLRPLVHRHEPVIIESWLGGMTAASMIVKCEIKDDETLYARASTVVVPYNLAEQRPRRITAQERAFLEGYLDEGAVAA